MLLEDIKSVIYSILMSNSDIHITRQLFDITAQPAAYTIYKHSRYIGRMYFHKDKLDIDTYSDTYGTIKYCFSYDELDIDSIIQLF